MEMPITLTNQFPAKTEWLRANTSPRPVGVDWEGSGKLLGMIVAQEGPFKTPGRGEFDMKSLRGIVGLMKKAPAGLKSHLGHQTLSSDGIGLLLGRVVNPRLDKISTREAEGVRLDNEINVVRADLHLSPASRGPTDDGKPGNPNGDIGGWLLQQAEADSDAISSSLVVMADQEHRQDKRGRPLLDDEGHEMLPLWRVTAVHAADIVDTGEAVDGLLSANLDASGLPDAVVRQAAALLDKQFGGCDRETLEARATAWLGRYLDLRFGEAAPEIDPQSPEAIALCYSVPVEDVRRALKVTASFVLPPQLTDAGRSFCAAAQAHRRRPRQKAEGEQRLGPFTRGLQACLDIGMTEDEIMQQAAVTCLEQLKIHRSRQTTETGVDTIPTQ